MKKTAYILLGVVWTAVITSCSTTRRLADGDLLYTGVRKIEFVSASGEKVPGAVESVAKEPLNVKPNNPLYSPYLRTPLPVGLWVWNNLSTERETGLRAWLYRKLAKSPVLVSDLQPDQRMEWVEELLDNLGYFGSHAEYETLARRNPKKVRMNYRITVAEPWFYSQIAFPPVQGAVTAKIDSLKTSSLLRVGAQYNIDTLSAERQRIATALREESYYYFRPEYLEYLADTLQEPFRVDLRMVTASGIPEEALRPYRIGSLGIELTNPLGGEADSTGYNGIQIRYQRPLKLRPKVMARALTLRPGEPIRVSEIEETLTNLQKLGVFRFVNLSVTPLDSLRGGDALDMQIAAAFDTPLDAELEVDFSSKSNSYIGPGLTFTLRNKNFLGGGEHLSVKLNGAYEWQTGNTASQLNASTINSYEVGVNTSLMIPRMVAPDFIPRSSRYEAKTTYQAGVALMNRPNFFTMLSANAAAVYDFRSDAASSHSFTPFKLTYNNLLRTTDEFDSLMADYHYIEMSFQNQFIPAMSYTYTFDRNIGRDQIVWQSTLTEAGNVIGGVQELFGGDARTMFGTPFSQFVKGTTELKYYKALGTKNTLAARLMAGAGHAYGNFDVMPYNEQFYIGGANSIRAFTIRSLGPGSYRPDQQEQFGYFDQTGSFKLEANVEFRFNLLGGLYGAVFMDAGNIWLLQNDPDRPGGQLTAAGFLDQVALGTGAGLRFDLSFLVLRADLGVAIHAPYNTGRSGYYNIPRFADGLGFHLAIGYPF